MCTVSVVHHAAGFRLVCNRDERRTRAAALPPALCRIGSTAAAWPRDPDSGGTWIGVNNAGLALGVLNRTPRRADGPVNGWRRSRGTIIPPLIGFRCLAAVTAAARRLPGSDFAPFTLLAVQERDLVEVRNHAGRMLVRRRTLRAPLIYTSSSLGDHLVQRPRGRLFHRMVRRAHSPLCGQMAFHRHAWRARPELSVCMARADAATVSRTVVDVARGSTFMAYLSIAR